MAIHVTKDKDDEVFATKCEHCVCEFDYQREDLGYRLWFPKGFIYCPKCKHPIRHRLENKKW